MLTELTTSVEICAPLVTVPANKRFKSIVLEKSLNHEAIAGTAVLGRFLFKMHHVAEHLSCQSLQ